MVGPSFHTEIPKGGQDGVSRRGYSRTGMAESCERMFVSSSCWLLASFHAETRNYWPTSTSLKWIVSRILVPFCLEGEKKKKKTICPLPLKALFLCCAWASRNIQGAVTELRKAFMSLFFVWGLRLCIAFLLLKYSEAMYFQCMCITAISL